jgi:ankyrin repeat protein
MQRGGARIHEAVRNGNLAEVEAALKAGADVNEASKGGWTPLQQAASKGHLDILNRLIAAGADLNKVSKDGSTPLLWVAYKGHLDILNRLIAAGADLNKVSKDGSTPLLWVAYKGHLDILNRLIVEGADINKADNLGQTPLLMAVNNEHLLVMNALIAAGADLNKASVNGVTPLGWAASKGHLDIVNTLIAAGADINKADSDGFTPLGWAVSKGHLEILNTLIAAGADINTADSEGFTPLHKAVQKGHLGIVNALIAAGADLNKDKYGWTPLGLAVYKEHLEIVKALIAGGANINKVDNLGQTPLQQAAEKGYLEIVRALLDDPKIIVGESIRDRACTGKFSPEINNLVCAHKAPLWKGFSQSTIAMYDLLLNSDAPAVGMRPSAENWSACPVCLKYAYRASGCMYMNHNCSAEPGGLFHKRLYDMYKSDQGKIYWCTICSRICFSHRHYKLSTNDVKAELTPPSPSPNLFGPDSACRAQGGGGIDEKIARIRRMREYALELEGKIDRMAEIQAMNKLIEEAWNAPLEPYAERVAKIRTNRAWNHPSANFHANATIAVEEENAGPAWNITYPNIENPELLPVIHKGGVNTMTFNNVDNAIQFRHKTPNGEVNNHVDEYIDIDYLFTQVLKTRRAGPERGRCWNYPICTALMYPAELQHILTIATGISEENMKTYREELERYTKSFGEAVIEGGRRKPGPKTRRKLKGGVHDDERLTIGPATLVECVLKNREVRKTRRNRHNASSRKRRL